MLTPFSLHVLLVLTYRWRCDVEHFEEGESVEFEELIGDVSTIFPHRNE